MSNNNNLNKPPNLFVTSVKDQSLGLGLNSTTSLPSSPTNITQNNANNQQQNNGGFTRSQSYNHLANTTNSPLSDQRLTSLQNSNSSSTNSLANSIDFNNSPLHSTMVMSGSNTPNTSSSILSPYVPLSSNNNQTVYSPIHNINNNQQPIQVQPSQLQPIGQNTLVLQGDETTLKRLIRIGNWSNVFKVADMCIAATNNPLSILQYKLCRIVAHVKMKNHKIAYDEIQGIGDIRDLINCYDAYPQLFPNKKGTMVPFSMRVLKAELAFHLQLEKYQLDALYALLSICKREIINLEQHQDNLLTKSSISKTPNNQGGSGIGASLDQQQIFLSQVDATSQSLLTPSTSPSIHPTSSSPPTSSHLHLSPVTSEDIFENDQNNGLMIWRLRERRIVFSIVTLLIQKNKDYLLAIKILEDLIHRQQADQWIVSAMGRIHLQMGNVIHAAKVFKVADRLIPEPEISLVSNMNKGFLAVASDQYPKAIEYFEKVLQLDPTNVAAANNKAIAMLYTCDLSGSVHTIEQLIAKEKEHRIDDTIIFNICSLYELSSENSNEKKKAIKKKFGVN